MDTTLEPETLRDREDVTVETETRTVTGPEFETARDLESRVTIGVANDADEVLLVADGARGWTLPGAPVGPDEEWDGVVRGTLESLTGVGAVDDPDPVRVRTVEFRQDGADRRLTTHDVLVRTTVRGRPVDDEPTVAGEPVADLVWLESVPEDVAEAVVTDVRSVLERAADE